MLTGFSKHMRILLHPFPRLLTIFVDIDLVTITLINIWTFKGACLVSVDEICVRCIFIKLKAYKLTIAAEYFLFKRNSGGIQFFTLLY